MMSWPGHHWAPPPLPVDATRRERELHAAAATYARHQIRWIWSEVCSGLHLVRRVVPTGTMSFEPPRIGRIELGPPTSFTVELRPGQLREDVAQLAPRLAAALEVPEVRVEDLVRGWIVVQLVEDAGDLDIGPARRPTGQVGPSVDAGRGGDGRELPPARPHFPRRGRRGPFRRPRSTG